MSLVVNHYRTLLICKFRCVFAAAPTVARSGAECKSTFSSSPPGLGESERLPEEPREVVPPLSSLRCEFESALEHRFLLKNRERDLQRFDT